MIHPIMVNIIFDKNLQDVIFNCNDKKKMGKKSQMDGWIILIILRTAHKLILYKRLL